MVFSQFAASFLEKSRRLKIIDDFLTHKHYRILLLSSFILLSMKKATTLDFITTLLKSIIRLLISYQITELINSLCLEGINVKLLDIIILVYQVRFND